jgi:Tol biopolymer transport system component
MKHKTTLRMGVVIIAATAAAFALSASAGAGPVTGPNGPRASHIAYTSTVDGQADIYSMTTEGFGQINLSHDKTIGLRTDSEPAWSPDGQYVAFQRASTKSETGTQLFVVRSDGSGLHAIASSSNVAASNMHPNWSPDGKTIVFSSNRTGHFELYMVNVGAGPTPQPPVTKATQLTFTKAGVDNLEPAWAPNGKSIAFVRHEWSVFGEIPSFPTDSIYVLLLNSSTTHPTYRITDPGLGKSDCQPAWSGDSNQIAFESNRVGKEDIYVVDRKGNGLRRITPLTSNEFHPSWASLGSQIVLISDRTGATEIYTLTLTVPVLGSTTPMPAMKQLTFDKAPKANPAMERIMFMGPSS